MLLLSGCAQGISNDTQSTDLVLPRLVQYSQSTQNEAAREVEICTNCELLKTFAKHYGDMREEVRAAQEALNEL